MAKKLTKEELAQMIDHTNLHADITLEAVEKLCAEARDNHFKMVAINPAQVVLCKKLLKDTDVHVGAAIGFPLGQEVDYCIIEAGMGGRLDATTALDYNACLITNVGLDHTEYLGDTFEQIAYEKSGIFKPNVPALTTEDKPECQKVMELVADYMNTPLCFVDCQETDVLRWNGMTFHLNPPLYQAKNLSLALET